MINKTDDVSNLANLRFQACMTMYVAGYTLQEMFSE